MQLEQKNKSLIKTMRFKYLAALSLVALLSFCSFTVITLLIQEQSYSGAIVNASGRRRYTSQRIVLFATKIVYSKDQAKIDELKQNMKATIERFSANHRGLVYGSEALNLPGNRSPVVSAFYFEQPKNFAERLDEYIKRATNIVNAPLSELTEENPDYQYIAKHGPTDIIDDLEEMVNLYQEESDAKIKIIRYIELLIFLSTLTLLTLEGIFIFQPMVNLIKKTMNQLTLEMSKMSMLLDNMTQAVFSVDEKGMIVDPVSHYCDTVFKQQIVNKNIFDVLYKDLKSDQETLSMIKSSFSVIYNSNRMQYDLVADNLISDITLNQGQQELKVLYAPITNEQNEIDKMLFIVQDVTEVNKLDRKHKIEKENIDKNIRMMHEIFAKDFQEVKIFLENSLQNLQLCRNANLNNELKSEDKFTLLRELHTIKGNARMQGLKLISSIVHNIEGKLLNIFSEASAAIQQREHINTGLEEVAAIINEYILFMNKLNPTIDTSSHLSATNRFKVDIYTSNYKRLQSAIQSQNCELTFTNFQRLFEIPLTVELQKFGSYIEEISVQLHKKISLVVTGDDASLDKYTTSILSDAIGHLLRNAVDHGIESPEERLNLGKNESGRITIDCQEQGDQIVVTMKDDGRGINGEELSKLAVKNNLLTASAGQTLTPQQKCELIFIPGLSTKKDTTELSGRGVGGNAVKLSLEKISGTIVVQSTLKQFTEFKITVPKSNSKKVQV